MRNILVLGASSSIGIELLKLAAGPDTNLFAHFNNSESAISILASNLNEKITPIKADLSSEAEVHGLIASVESKCKSLDGIVFLAAPPLNLVRFKNVEWSDYIYNFEVQLKSTILILKNFLPSMVKQKSGSIVMMLSSVTEGKTPAIMSHYVVSKFSLFGLMRALSAEYSSANICINGVSASMIDSSFMAAVPHKIIEMAAESHPRKRNATPKDIAPVINFLLSDDAQFITGANLVVTGGA